MVSTTKHVGLKGRVATVVATCLASFTLASCGLGQPPEFPSNVTDLRVGAAPSLAGIGVYAALRDGDFDEFGLNVSPAPNRSANETVPQLLNGGVDIAMMDMVTFYQARSQGLPIVGVAFSGIQATDGGDGVMSGAGVIVKANSTINGALDLQGASVGVPAIKTQTWMNIRAVVDKSGGDSEKIDFVEIPPAQSVDLVANGRVDASSPNQPMLSGAVNSGQMKLVHASDVPGMKGAPSSVFVAAEGFAEKNPEAISNFAKAVYAANTRVNNDRDYAIDVATTALMFKPEQVENAFFPALAEEDVPEEKLRQVSDLALQYDLLEKEPDFENLMAKKEGGN